MFIDWLFKRPQLLTSLSVNDVMSYKKEVVSEPEIELAIIERFDHVSDAGLRVKYSHSPQISRFLYARGDE
jgi:hypothetical protein